MDYAVFRLINDFAGRFAWLDHLMVFVSEYMPLLFIAALFWLWGVRSRGARSSQDRLAVGRALAAAALALALGQLIGWLYFRPRPFADHAVRLLIPPSPDPSFPSDHALAAFAIAGAVVSTRRLLGLGLFLLATLLALARVFVGTHYPLDVFAGAILGAAISRLIHRADPWLGPVVRPGDRWTNTLWHRISSHAP